MDPISLSVLFGAGWVGGRAFRSYQENQSPENTPVIRPVFHEDRGFLAHELCNEAALREVGQVMDMDLAGLSPKVDTGFFRVVAITQPGAPLTYQVIAIFTATGPYGWILNQAYHAGFRMVSGKVHFEHIHQVLDAFNTDPAKVAITKLESIKNPAKRQQYLHELMRNPELVRLLQSEPEWNKLTGMAIDGAPDLQYALPAYDE